MLGPPCDTGAEELGSSRKERSSTFHPHPVFKVVCIQLSAYTWRPEVPLCRPPLEQGLSLKEATVILLSPPRGTWTATPSFFFF